MKRTLTEWRESLCRYSCRSSPRFLRTGVFGIALTVAAAAVLSLSATTGLANAAPGAATGGGVAAEAEPGTKQLLKASGLFENKLFKLAAQEYQQFLQEYPNHPDATNARYALAICEYREGAYDKAVDLLAQVLRDPKFDQRDEATAVLGHSQLAAGHYDKALAAFDELLAKFPQSKHAEVAALNRAQVLYLAKRYPDAAAAASSFLRQYGNSAERPAAMYFLALSQRAQDQNDQAAATLQELLSKHPDTRYKLDATLLLGQALESQGKLDAAAEQYRRMIAAAPASRKADGHYSLGLVLSKSAKFDEAARDLTAVITDSPDSPYAKPARLQLGLVQLAGGRTAEARRTLTAVAREDAPNAAAARYGLAQVDIAEKRFDSALGVLEDLLRQTPPPANAAQVGLDRAVCLAELGRHDEAAAEFAKLSRQHPDTPQAAEAQYRQAFSLHKLGKFDESHALAAKLAAGKSDFAAAAAELDGENLFLTGKYKAAAKAFTDLAAAAKDAAKKNRFTFRLGQCAYFSADYAKAVELLRPLAEDPSLARDEALGRAAFLLGDALLQQGKYAEAAAALQKYVTSAGISNKADRQEAQFKLALAQLRANQIPAAQENLQAAAGGPSDSPWTLRALFELGQFAYKQQPPQLDKAARALGTVLASNAPEELAAPAAYLLGWIDYDARKFTDAAARWKELVGKYGKSQSKETAKLVEDAAFQQGVALREAGKNEEALVSLQVYTKDYPSGQHLTQAKQLTAAALSALKRDDEAKLVLGQLAAGKTSDTVLYDLAWTQKGTNDKAAAVATYRRLIKDFPASKLAPAAKTELAELLYADKQYADAAGLLETVVTTKDADPKVLNAAGYLLGWCYEKLGKSDQAAEAFSRYASATVSANAGNAAGPDADRAASALLQAGIAYASKGRFSEATRSLQEVLQKFPQYKDAPVAMLKLGEVLADAGEFDSALRTNSEFLQKYGTNPFAYRAQFGVGWALENQKKYAEARAAYKKVADSTAGGETAARAQFQIGETLLAESKFEEAIKELLAVEYVYAFPKWSARALYEAGRAFEQLKQPDQAKQQYAKVVAKYKDQPEAELAQERMKAMKGP